MAEAMTDRTTVAVTRRAIVIRPTAGVVRGWTARGVLGRRVGRHDRGDARLRMGQYWPTDLEEVRETGWLMELGSDRRRGQGRTVRVFAARWQRGRKGRVQIRPSNPGRQGGSRPRQAV